MSSQALSFTMLDNNKNVQFQLPVITTSASADPHIP
jgi:hypothetical protein